jgi:hypothetical protein
MAFQDRFRAFMFGLDAGVPACELAWEKVLLFRDLPYVLENAFTRWLMLQDELLCRDTPARAIRFDERDRTGVTWAVWGRFLDWMSAQLGGSSEGQGGPHDAAHALREGMAARTPISELHDEPELYLDAAPVELRAALRRWLDASLDALEQAREPAPGA